MRRVMHVARDSHDVAEVEADGGEDPLHVRHRPPHFLFEVTTDDCTLFVHRGLTGYEDEAVRLDGSGKGRWLEIGVASGDQPRTIFLAFTGLSGIVEVRFIC